MFFFVFFFSVFTLILISSVSFHCFVPFFFSIAALPRPTPAPAPAPPLPASTLSCSFPHVQLDMPCPCPARSAPWPLPQPHLAEPSYLRYLSYLPICLTVCIPYVEYNSVIPLFRCSVITQWTMNNNNNNSNDNDNDNDNALRNNDYCTTVYRKWSKYNKKRTPNEWISR